MFARTIIRPLALAVALALAAPVGAQAIDAPYERDLMRLAELLGSLHYLRNLCGEEGTQYRDQMQALLNAEATEEARRARFIARFNLGYRSFGSTYTSCTNSAVTAIERYMIEGQNLTRDIVNRYGN